MDPPDKDKNTNPFFSDSPSAMKKMTTSLEKFGMKPIKSLFSVSKPPSEADKSDVSNTHALPSAPMSDADDIVATTSPPPYNPDFEVEVTNLNALNPFSNDSSRRNSIRSSRSVSNTPKSVMKQEAGRRPSSSASTRAKKASLAKGAAKDETVPVSVPTPTAASTNKKPIANEMKQTRVASRTSSRAPSSASRASTPNTVPTPTASRASSRSATPQTSRPPSSRGSSRASSVASARSASQASSAPPPPPPPPQEVPFLHDAPPDGHFRPVSILSGSNRSSAFHHVAQPLSPAPTELLPRHIPPGVAQYVIPGLSGGRMNLSGRVYPENQISRVLEAMKEAADPEAISRNFFTQLAMKPRGRDILEDNKQFRPDITQLPPASSTAVNEVDKHMKRLINGLLNADSPKFKATLNAFVTQCNLHRLNAEQASSLLPSYFDDTLQSSVSRDIDNKGLLKTVQDLRLLLCPASTISLCSEKTNEFKLDPNNLRKSLYLLADLIVCANPGLPAAVTDGMVMNQFMYLAPSDVAAASRKKAKEFRDNYPHSLYTFEIWRDDIVQIICARPKGQKFLKHIEEEPVDSENSQEQHRSPSHGQEVYAVSLPDVTQPPPNHRPGQQQNSGKQQNRANNNNNNNNNNNANNKKQKEFPKPATTEQIKKAQRTISLKMLISAPRDYPHDHQNTLPYSFVNDKFVPDEPIMRAPDKPTFLSYSSGTTVLANAISDHYRGRCSSCGMVGHSAVHPGCVYARGTPTWHLCNRCKAGFHADAACVVDLSKVTPHVYQQAPK